MRVQLDGLSHIDIDVDAHLANNGKIASLLKDIERLHGGGREGQARARADVEGLLRAQIMQLKRVHGDLRGRALDALMKTYREVRGFYMDMMLSRGKADAGRLRALLEQMATHFDDLDRPLSQLAHDVNPERVSADAGLEAIRGVGMTSLVDDRPGRTPLPLEFLTGTERATDLAKRGWTIRGNEAVRSSANGSRTATARFEPHEPVTVTIEQSGSKQQIREWEVLEHHKDRPEGAGNVLQSHHGAQNAYMKKLFERFGYREDDVPTIWLLDSITGTPHHRVSVLQGRREAPKSFGEIRDQCVMDLNVAVDAGRLDPSIAARAIQDYMRKLDKYFDDVVLEAMKSKLEDPAQLAALLGTRTKYY